MISTRTKVLAPLILLVAGVFVVFYYHVDPSAADSITPRCAFRVLTGYDCPGCGAQRAFHALLHGDVSDAWAYNPYIFFALPVALVYILTDAMPRRAVRLRRILYHPVAVAVILVSVLGWWILRNIP